MTAKELLTKAQALISGPRPREYGTFEDNVSDIQILMSAMTSRRPSRHEVHSFILSLKLCRNKGEGWSEDTMVDFAAYAALINADNKI